MAVDEPAGQAVPGRQLRRAADLLPLTPEAAAARFDLGVPTAPPERHHGGVNELWRLRTARGAFAVHVLTPRPHLLERCEGVLAVERAAAAAGVALAEPVPDPVTGRAAVELAPDRAVVVHEWVGAEPVDPDRSPPLLYRRLGASLARLHALGLDPTALPGDDIDVRPSEDEWRALADAAGAPGLRDAAGELVEAIEIVDGWDRESGEAPVLGHRDLTSMNVLDRDGTPVLIDWEDVGPIAPGTEIGRTALDNLGRAGELDDELLRTYLAGYAEVAAVPTVGPHWCSLWVRGLVVFAAHCARSVAGATADPALLELQSDVVARTAPELRRRLAIVPQLVAAFERALSGSR